MLDKIESKNHLEEKNEAINEHVGYQSTIVENLSLNQNLKKLNFDNNNFDNIKQMCISLCENIEIDPVYKPLLKRSVSNVETQVESIESIVSNIEIPFDISKLDYEKIKNKIYKINVLKEWSFYENLSYREIQVISDNIDSLQDKITLGFDRRTNQRLDWNGTKTIIQNYCKQIQKNTVINYKPCKKSKKGRHFSKSVSLQGISRTIRHTLCRNKYVDIDISNAHPIIFLSLCKTYNFDCSDILDFVENRNARIKSLMDWTGWDKDKTKQTVLSILNGGQCSEIFNQYGVIIPSECKWIEKFKNQIYKIHLNFFEHSDFSEHKIDLIKNEGKNVFNFNGKLVNKVLCEYENILIQHAMDYCYRHNIEIAANCFDGLLIKNLNFNGIKSIEDFVVSETGIPVKFVIKEMNEGIDISKLKTKQELKLQKVEELKLQKQELKEELKLQKEEELKELYTLKEKLSDENMAKYFVKDTDDILYKDILQDYYYMYNDENCLYEKIQDISLISKKFTKIFLPYFNDIVPSNDFEDNYITIRKMELLSTKGQAYLVSMIKKYIPDSTEFIVNNFNRKNLFPFQDKIVDFSIPYNNELFIRKRTKEDFFTFTTNNNYKFDFDKEWIIKYASELLMTDDLIYIMCYYTLLAHGLTNDNSIKLLIFLIGEGDNGKTVAMNLYKKILGEFCCIDSSKAILEKRGSCLDTEKFILIGKRVATMSEMRKEDKLDITFVKSYIGNDIDFKLRPSAKSMQINVKIDPKTFIPTNEMPTIKGTDNALLKRIGCFNFKNTFQRSSNKITEIMSKSDDLFTFLCQIASELTSKNFDFTMCDQMYSFTREIKNTFDSVGGFMDEIMELTDNKDDCISGNDLYNYYSSYCIKNDRDYINLDSFGKTLRRDPYKYDSTERKKKKKVAGKSVIYYFYIKKKNLEDSLEDEFIADINR